MWFFFLSYFLPQNPIILHFCSINDSLRWQWLRVGTISTNWSNPIRILARRFCSDAIWFAFFCASLKSSWGGFLPLPLPLGLIVSSSLLLLNSLLLLRPIEDEDEEGDEGDDDTRTLSPTRYLRFSTFPGFSTGVVVLRRVEVFVEEVDDEVTCSGIGSKLICPLVVYENIVFVE